jgi:hypothetical protein
MFMDLRRSKVIMERPETVDGSASIPGVRQKHFIEVSGLI